MDLGFRCKGNHIIAEFLYQFRRAINIKTEKQEAPKKKKKDCWIKSYKTIKCCVKNSTRKSGKKIYVIITTARELHSLNKIQKFERKITKYIS